MHCRRACEERRSRFARVGSPRARTNGRALASAPTSYCSAVPTDAALTTSVDDAADLADQLIDAWGSWGPNMTPDARAVAFISDRSGVPQLWIQDVVLDGPPPEARHLPLSPDPVLA